ncbi:MAG: flagellar biosynthesis anti-sigma factor FlgM [Paracoccaceae bacterium]|jgi:negative regulator of flagellin synthesis FlgM|nr:flagellar biosynthesis anti-sigma factor FlgM [Paracoccaceae bacterium]MDC3389504.1 flagellar biosynthesis anti-sigma factor FlgM [bacterium]MDG1259219.1 flagellar biosynthesis anti-sigma factor FlgM [Paracoccaceae bacterium]
MVDAPTAITGNAAAMQMSVKPTENIAQEALKTNALRGKVLTEAMPSEVDTYDAVGVGGAVPVVQASSTAKVAVEINSTSREVLSSMRQLPAPVDIEAVDRVRKAIADNNYPIDLGKIADNLVQAFEDLGPPPRRIS